MTRSVRIKKPLRHFLYFGILTSFLTGLGYALMNQWVLVEGNFGPEKHPLQFILLKIHGASAFLNLILFGFILSSHISVSWVVKRMRISGIPVVGVTVILILTGYLLYYAGREDVRQVALIVHLVSGCLLPMIIATHVIHGKKRKKKVK